MSDNLGLGSNLGADWNSGVPAFIYSLVLGIDIADDVGAFIEVFGNAPKSEKANHLIDFGITYNIYNNLQLDASAGYALTEWTDDYFINGGVSFRLPQ
ncbi:transporter [Bacteroidota bacterium]